jgi:hypothetical protein
MDDNALLESKMTALVEARQLVRLAAEPCPAGDSVKAAVGRAARRLKWNYTRVRALWYGDDRIKVSGDELNELRRAAGARQKAEVQRDELAARVEALEQQLRDLAMRMPQDADFYGSQADLIRDAARHVGRADHPEG